MVKTGLSLLLAWISVCLSSAKLYTCDPVTDCAAEIPGAKVPDPDDCSRYYVCDIENQPSPSSFPCGTGFYFSSVEEDCVAGTSCSENLCNLSQTCSVDCSSSSTEEIPVPGDCTMFYRCDDPSNEPGNCPDDAKYFNGKECVNDMSQCCTVCDVVCFQDFTLVVDPNDCHSYYFCNGTDGTLSNTCDEGEYFNSFSLTCETETEPCQSFCPDGEPNYGLDATASPPDVSGTPPEGAITTVTPFECDEDFRCPVSEGEFTYCDACIATHYDCSTGTPTKVTCPTGQVFDYTIQQCIDEALCPTFN